MHIDTETHYYTYAAAERAVRELLSQFEGDYNYETLAAEVLVTGNNGPRQYWAITSAADTASAREIQEVLDRHRIRFTPLGIDFTAAWPTFDAAITQGILPVLAQFEGTFDVDAIAAEVLREDRSGHIHFIPGAAEATREQIQDVLDRHRLDAAPSVEAPPSVEAQATHSSGSSCPPRKAPRAASAPSANCGSWWTTCTSRCGSGTRSSAA